jgi:hypothetical protein
VLRGTGRTVATGCGRTASEASRCDRHGTCFDDGVPFRANQLTRFWPPPPLSFSRGREFPQFPSTPRSSSLFHAFDFFAPAANIAVVLDVAYPARTPVTGPYAKWISLISKVSTSRSWLIIVFKSSHHSLLFPTWQGLSASGPTSRPQCSVSK